jgi:hypothetical protein
MSSGLHHNEWIGPYKRTEGGYPGLVLLFHSSNVWGHSIQGAILETETQSQQRFLILGFPVSRRWEINFYYLQITESWVWVSCYSNTYRLWYGF